MFWYQMRLYLSCLQRNIPLTKITRYPGFSFSFAVQWVRIQSCFKNEKQLLRIGAFRNIIQVRKLRGTDWISSNRHLTQFPAPCNMLVLLFLGFVERVFLDSVIAWAGITLCNFIYTIIPSISCLNPCMYWLLNLWLTRIYKIFQFLVHREYLFVLLHHISMVFSSYFLCTFLLLFS